MSDERRRSASDRREASTIERAGFRCGGDGAERSEPLGPLELALLQLLWAHGGWVSAPELHEELAKERPLAYTTVSTVLIRLWHKGHLERARDGRAYAYRAVSTREQHAADRMAMVLSEIDDRPRALGWFVEHLDADERTQLRRLLRRMDERS